MTTFNDFPDQVYNATLTGSNGVTVTGSLSPNKVIIKLDENSFIVDGTEKLEVNGNIYTSGIRFDISGDLLSDYEEGTWTPEIAGVDLLAEPPTETIFSTTVSAGKYIKIGKMVYAQANIQISSLNSANEPFIVIRDLPYYGSNNNDGFYGYASLTLYYDFDPTFDKVVFGRVDSDNLILFKNGLGTVEALSIDDIGYSSVLSLNICYSVY